MLRPFVSIFLTARPHIDYRDIVRDLKEVYPITISANDSDIRTYLTARIGDSQRLKALLTTDPSLEGDIVVAVCQKAQGMYV